MITATKKKTKKAALSGFYKDVIDGLQSTPKYLLSKYFYDKAGDALFQDIMACQEYYPTRCEMEILEQQSEAIVQAMINRGKPMDIIELGAGDATKSIHLLKALQKAGAEFNYYPIDISENVISQLERKLPEQLPGVRIKGICGEYFPGLAKIAHDDKRMKVVLFLGSTIGNMTPDEGVEFCKALHNQLSSGDMVFIGFDLKKNPQTILDAYNDRQGFTRAFNLNLLTRINRELDGDFNTENFQHYPVYDPISGACKSYLISKKKQQVHVGEISVSFEADEPVYMEISQKYSVRDTQEMARRSGFKQVNQYLDSKKWFADMLWQVLD
ncbi:L-histidine N(alpha)-methyltransferase [Chitinophagaceae bacterium MMS25-I14]